MLINARSMDFFIKPIPSSIFFPGASGRSLGRGDRSSNVFQNQSKKELKQGDRGEMLKSHDPSIFRS